MLSMRYISITYSPVGVYFVSLTVRSDIDGELEEFAVSYPSDIVSVRGASDVHRLLSSERLSRNRKKKGGSVLAK